VILCLDFLKTFVGGEIFFGIARLRRAILGHAT
jgi:hypothetical protein